MEQAFFPCAYCSRQFTDVRECYEHVRLHVMGEIESENQNSQEQQPISINGNKSCAPKWKRPARITPPVRNFTCEICDKKFATKRYLRQYHMLTHLECKHCSQSFVSLEEATEHRKIHKNEKVKVSQLKFDPNYKYVSEYEPDELEQNEKPESDDGKVLQDAKKFYVCNICQRKFSDLKYLMKKHIPTHLEPCKRCSQAFETIDEAIEHLNVHQEENTSEKPKAFECKFCKKSFKKISNLEKHLCKHDEEEKL